MIQIDNEQRDVYHFRLLALLRIDDFVKLGDARLFGFVGEAPLARFLGERVAREEEEDEGEAEMEDEDSWIILSLCTNTPCLSLHLK